MNPSLANPVLPSMQVAATQPTPTLALIRDLFSSFHASGLRYCHWKSNEHLGASMQGDTDLDILFDEEQKSLAYVLMAELGFKKFCSIEQKQYQDIEDFLGLDPASGKVVHVHSHFRLTMGEPYLKGYQLPLDDQVLDSRVYDAQYGVYCSHPAFELVLLFIREALKLRNRDRLLMLLGRRKEYNEYILREFLWLRQRVSNQQLEAVVKQLFTDFYPVYSLMVGEFDREQQLALGRLLRRKLRRYSMYTPLQALMLRWYREVIVRTSGKLARILNLPMLAKRINPRQGLAVAIIGADGSGKSTVVANLKSTFEPKLDVYKLYFGSGDGDKSLTRKILHGFRDLVKRNKKQHFGSKRPSGASKRGFLIDAYKCLEAMLIAREKHRNLKRMQEARQKGMLVICDRFPQNQLMGYNDGPLLAHLLSSPNPVFRMCARKEAAVYTRAQQNSPDVVFKLVADACVVEARKPGETPLEILRSKISGIKALNYSEACKVITIDAAQPFETVIRSIKKELWASLS